LGADKILIVNSLSVDFSLAVQMPSLAYRLSNDKPTFHLCILVLFFYILTVTVTNAFVQNFTFFCKTYRWSGI